MPDYDAITTALAGRYTNASLPGGTNPAGTNAIRGSSGDVPNELGALPYVYVFPDTSSFRTGGGSRHGVHKWIVRLYYAQAADLARDIAALRKYATVLVDQLKGAAQFGGAVSGVTVAKTDTARFVVLEYAGEKVSGLELEIGITTDEPWLATA